jgi:Zn-dependent peptidase ImmA (M78 family)
MPECDIRSNVNGFITIDRLLKLKQRWKVSLSALNYRIHKLGIITDWQYRTFCIEIRKRYGKNEPDSIKSNGSSLWRMIFSELWKDKITINHIARELSLPVNEIINLTKFESLDVVNYKEKLKLVN